MSADMTSNPAPNTGLVVAALVGAVVVGYVLLKPKKAAADTGAATDTTGPGGSEPAVTPGTEITPPTSGGGITAAAEVCVDQSPERIHQFAAARGYYIYYVEGVPLNQWKAPHAKYLSHGDDARAFSTIGCAFYKPEYTFGQFNKWVPDIETDNEFAMWLKFKQALEKHAGSS